MRNRIVAILAAMAVLLVGCGVADSGGASRVNPGLGLEDTQPTTTTSTTTTSTTVVEASSTSTGETELATTTTIVATEMVLLYFISGGQLTSISIQLPIPATLSQVVTALQSGLTPLGPLGAGLRSALPTAASIPEVTDDDAGIATVNLPQDFFDTIPSTDQRLAIAQIVLTLTKRPGIGQVRFSRGGQPTAVPLGSGEQSEAGQTVSRADYLSLTVNPTASTSTTLDPAGTPTTTTESVPSSASGPTTTAAS